MEKEYKKNKLSVSHTFGDGFRYSRYSTRSNSQFVSLSVWQTTGWSDGKRREFTIHTEMLGEFVSIKSDVNAATEVLKLLKREGVAA